MGNSGALVALCFRNRSEVSVPNADGRPSAMVFVNTVFANNTGVPKPEILQPKIGNEI